MLLAGWFVNCQEFSQVDRRVGVEAIISTIIVSSQNDGAETICLCVKSAVSRLHSAVAILMT